MSQPRPVPRSDDPNRIKILKKLAEDKDCEIDLAFVKKAEADVKSKQPRSLTGE